MAIDDASLERLLLTLGKRERELEQLAQRYVAEMRAALQAGEFERADDLEAKLDETKAQLSKLGPKIVQVEANLYGMRRRRK